MIYLKSIAATITILLSSVIVYSQNMKKTYKNEVAKALETTNNKSTEILTEQDISHLPLIVQKYLKCVGVIGKPKVLNFRAEFKGGIRSKSTDKFMPLTSVQYNFIDSPTRIFYIKAKKKGIPAIGLHLYKEQRAIMKVKIMGLFTVVDAKGFEMNQGETVTVFNDMCFMAPASLINQNIKWENINELSVKAKYTNGNINISAVLYFNEKGELINFISNDRFETTDGKTYKNYPWETPVLSYTNVNGYRLPSKAKLIYQRPTENFCYGEFELVNI